ncbi:hypothetical protein IPZ68_30580 [Streptomyces arenae]|nr:hypothetical protein [Streptomyces arenae]
MRRALVALGTGAAIVVSAAPIALPALASIWCPAGAARSAFLLTTALTTALTATELSRCLPLLTRTIRASAVLRRRRHDGLWFYGGLFVAPAHLPRSGLRLMRTVHDWADQHGVGLIAVPVSGASRLYLERAGWTSDPAHPVVLVRAPELHHSLS